MGLKWISLIIQVEVLLSLTSRTWFCATFNTIICHPSLVWPDDLLFKPILAIQIQVCICVYLHMVQLLTRQLRDCGYIWPNPTDHGCSVKFCSQPIPLYVGTHLQGHSNLHWTSNEYLFHVWRHQLHEYSWTCKWLKVEILLIIK